MADDDTDFAGAADYDLVPVDHQPQFADAPVPKAGQTVAPPNVTGQLATIPSMVGKVAADVTGVSDAYRALSGQMTPEDQQQMFVMALPGLIPGARAEEAGLRGASLAMDEASRMARATKQGYTLPAFHATEAPEFAKFDPSFIKDNVQYGGNFYFSTDPSFLNQRIMPIGGESGRMMPVLLKTENPFKMDQPITGNEAGSILRAMGEPDRAKTFEVEGDNPIKNWRKSTMFYFGMGQQTPVTAKADAIRKAGFDAIIGDPSQEITGTPGRQHVMVFDPDQIRSRFAEFHPESVGTGDIMGRAPQPQGIRAYHGSPYDFDQFDLSKIGTGEGAQAYGHGLYFAENPATAEEYKKNVSGDVSRIPPRRTFQGQELEPGSAPYHAGTLLETMGRTLPGVRKEVQGWITNAKPGEDVAHYQGVLDTLNKATSKKDFGVLPPKSLMYEVNINADPEHFLDWDKPLSEQPDAVKNNPKFQEIIKNEAYNRALASTSKTRADQLWAMVKDPMTAPAGFAQDLLKKPETSEALREAGIPGIKYLDQGSRNNVLNLPDNPITREAKNYLGSPDVETALDRFRKNQAANNYRDWGRTERDQIESVIRDSFKPQTSNYVVFNDKLIDIVKKYGLAGVVGAGASHFQTVPVDHQPDFGDQPQERAAGGRVEAANIDAEPTEAQKKAGNYAKDHVHVHGLDITIENAKGHYRRGIGGDGKPWQVKMPAHYGYIKGTVGKDKDHVDVYLGPHLQSPTVWIVDQVNADSRKFDEHKAFVGFASKQQVVETYRKAFSDGRAHERLGHLTRMNIETFKHWLETGDMKKTADAHFFPDAPRDNDKNKTTKKEAAYRGGNAKKRCGICSMYVPPSSCTAVRGVISPWAVCKFFERKK